MRTLAQTGHEELLHLLLLRSNELHGKTFLSRSRGTSRSMHVHVRRTGELVVHHMRHGGNVETTRSDVGREENRVGRGLESGRGQPSGREARGRTDRAT